MPSIVCNVINRKGMHARAAARIVAIVSNYRSKVTLTHKNCSASGDSLLKLLTLDAPKGSEIKIEADGVDASILLDKLQQLFADGFGE